MEEKKTFSIRRMLRDFIIVSCIFSLIVGYTGYCIARLSTVAVPSLANGGKAASVTVVIDPGHGGEDGGAVAADGTLEKDMNLLYGACLLDMCRILGIDAVITRDGDELLYDRYGDLADYTGQRKVYDLKNRLRFTKEIGEGAIFVGIHMNKFPDPVYNGTQVYYSQNSNGSKALAQIIRGAVKEQLQPDNEREIKPGGSSIYLLKRLTVPSVLVECGFLSNDEETERLKDAEYKKEFSLTLAVSIGEFIEVSQSPSRQPST